MVLTYPFVPSAAAASSLYPPSHTDLCDRCVDVLFPDAGTVEAGVVDGNSAMMRLRGMPGGSVVHDVHSRTVRFIRFPTVGAPGLATAVDVVYYEVDVLTKLSGPQVGFATTSFKISVDESCDTGIGDDEHSWGVDGEQGLVWHNEKSSQWDCQWAIGDVISLAHNSEVGKFAVAKNGQWLGIVLAGVALKNAAYPAMSLAFGTLRYRLQQPFRYGPPEPAMWQH